MVTSVDHPRPTVARAVLDDPVCFVLLVAITTMCIVGGAYLIVAGALMKLGLW